MSNPCIVTVKLAAPLEWRVTQDTQSGHLLAVCADLGLAMSGQDETDLKQAIADTQQMLLASLLDDGDLESYAARRGWLVETSGLPRQSCGVYFDLSWALVDARQAR